MKFTEEGLALLKLFEGCQLDYYRDSAGILTIGYGHTAGVTPGMHITQQQADNFLSNDLYDTEQHVTKLLTREVNDDQYSALVCLAYNIGVGNLRSSTLLRLVNAGEDPSSEWLKWNHAGGVVLEGLTRRRQAELHLFNSAC